LLDLLESLESLSVVFSVDFSDVFALDFSLDFSDVVASSSAVVFTAFTVLVSSAGVGFGAVVVFDAVVTGATVVFGVAIFEATVFGTTTAFFVLGVAAFVVAGGGVAVDVSVVVALLEPVTTCRAGSVTVVVVDVTGAVVEVVVPATEVVVDGVVEVATPTVAGSAAAWVATGADVDVVVPATAADRAAAVSTDTATASWSDWAADTCSGGVGSPGCGSATIGAVGAVKICSRAERGTAGSVAGSTKGRKPLVREPGAAAGRVAPT
jgi:hypothetical protein